MSLLGVDLGSSSIKCSAYSVDGRLLAVVSHGVNPLHEQPGWWETDPQDMWQAMKDCLLDISREPALKKDPPAALAISASGRENFPADREGNPLGNNLMGADLRGAEFETPPPGTSLPEAWTLSCGHPRERMDPVLRLMWWKKARPDVMEKARMYPDWHGFMTLRLCGRNVSERSLTGRWAIYDLNTRTWNPQRMREFGVEDRFLPEVLEGGQAIERIKPGLAREFGLPGDLLIVTGAHDLNCAGIGAGVSKPGMACLISGSYENMLIPTTADPTYEMLANGLSITPHPAAINRSVYAICPTGNAVLNWAREVTRLSLEESARELDRREPSPVIALPYLSGMMLYGKEARKLRGTLLGMTLATTRLDILQAFMEGIAYDNANTLQLLAKEGIPVTQIRATGGGTRSEWWTQLKADVMNSPIEVSSEPEPGTLGAAILAGIGAGIYASVEEASRQLCGTVRIYEPNPERASLHTKKMKFVRSILPGMLEGVYQKWPEDF
jgi:xylulokinase